MEWLSTEDLGSHSSGQLSLSLAMKQDGEWDGMHPVWGQHNRGCNGPCTVSGSKQYFCSCGETKQAVTHYSGMEEGGGWGEG